MSSEHRSFFVDVAEAVISEPAWVIKDLLPPGLVFLGGPPKSNKSTITMAMAAIVAGWPSKVLPPFLSELTQPPGRTLAFSYEATGGELRWLLEKGMHAKPVADESIMVADDPWDFRLDDVRGKSDMEYWLKELGPRLVILDPLRDFHSLDENDSGEMVRMLRPLRQWAVGHESTCIIVHHTRKLGENSTSYNPESMRGSSALFAMADGVLMLQPAPPKDSGTLKVQATFKRARGWERTIVLGCPGFGWPEQGHEPLLPIEEKVRVLLRAGGSTLEIQEQLHMTESAVSDCRMKLRRNGLE